MKRELLKKDLFIKMENTFKEQLVKTIYELNQAGVIPIGEGRYYYQKLAPYLHFEGEKKLIEIYGISKTNRFFIQLKNCEIDLYYAKVERPVNEPHEK